VKFATNVYLHFAFSYFTRNTDNLIVGGDTVRGVRLYKELTTCSFSQSRSCSPRFAVVVATLSRLSRCVSNTALLLAALPVLAFRGMGLESTSRSLAGISFGSFWSGWEEAGRIFVLFGPGVGIMLLYNTRLDSPLERSARPMVPLGRD